MEQGLLCNSAAFMWHEMVAKNAHTTLQSYGGGHVTDLEAPQRSNAVAAAADAAAARQPGHFACSGLERAVGPPTAVVPAALTAPAVAPAPYETVTG